MMGKPTGFLEFQRAETGHRPVLERVKDYDEFMLSQDAEALRVQGSRCMDCGVPYCHAGYVVQGLSIGCPLSNLVPEVNDLVYRGDIEEAYARLSKTHPFPEFTSRVCPALCEGSCTLGEHEFPVTVKEIERYVVDEMLRLSKLQPQMPRMRTGKKVAVVGSGPSGLACADLLNQLGDTVTVFERADRPGGLLMYGIPNMKLSKSLVINRVTRMEEEGVEFVLSTEVGKDFPVLRLMKEYDAIVLCAGSTQERTIDVPGKDLEGVMTAVDFLTRATKGLLDGGSGSGAVSGFGVRGANGSGSGAGAGFGSGFSARGAVGTSGAGAALSAKGANGSGAESGGFGTRGANGSGAGAGVGFGSGANGGSGSGFAARDVNDLGPVLTAKDRNVVIIGGGDTGTDCVATAIRQGAKSVTQLEIMPCLPESRAEDNPWPLWPKVRKTDYGQQEAIAIFGSDPREYLTTVKEIVGGNDGRVKAVKTVNVEWVNDGGRMVPTEVPGSEQVRPAELVLTAMGFTGPERTLIDQLELETDARGNVATPYDSNKSSLLTVFTAGDMRRGPSLVVWAIWEGRRAAAECHGFITER